MTWVPMTEAAERVTVEVSIPAVPGAVAFDLYTGGGGFVERIYVEEDPDWWDDRWDGGDAGPGMLIEELLDDSTLEYIHRRDRRRAGRRA